MTTLDPTAVATNAYAPAVLRAQTDDEVWTLGHRVLFRVLFIYSLLYFFPLPSGLAGPEFLSSLFDPVWQRIVPWIGRTLFGLEVANFSNGSGDTLYDYMRVATMASIALLGGTVWSIVDRRRLNYVALHGWAHVWLRYALAICLMTYGTSKVIKLQFPTPGYGRLMQTVGEMSPMGLLWTFMGFSTAYTFIAGAMEVLPALLLFFRRTATLGALISLVVMTNIAILNFCYDVPVKLGSTHLVLASLLLLAPHLRRLGNAVLGRATAPARDMGPRFESRTMQRVALALNLAIAIGVTGMLFWQDAQAYRIYGNRGNPAPPDGWYAVSSLKRDGTELPPLATNGERWKTFVLLRGYVRLWGFDGSTRLFKVDGTPDREFKLLLVDDRNQPYTKVPPVAQLRFHLAANGQATLNGTFEGHAIDVAMERKRSDDFPLMKRGFHWISEFPYNR